MMSRYTGRRAGIYSAITCDLWPVVAEQIESVAASLLHGSDGLRACRLMHFGTATQEQVALAICILDPVKVGATQ